MKHFLLIFLFFLIFVNPVLAAAPSIPQNFEANISDTTVNISWDESTDAENDTIVYNWVLVNSTGYENITHTVRNESMMLYTHFNDGTSTDWSLYGNNGTIYNGTWAASDHGWALDFNGTSTYVNCGNGSTLDITNAITMEMLIYVADDINPYLVDKGLSYRLRLDAGKIRVLMYIGGAVKNVYSPSGSIANDTLYHIVSTYDKNDGTNVMYLYLNGVDVSTSQSNTGGGGAIDTTVDELMIGKLNGYGYYFGGAMSFFRLYNRALSATEVNANYNIIAESASYNNFTGTISNLSYGEYHIIVNARDNSTYSEWSEVYNFSITQPPELFKASFKIIDQYRSDLVYNAYVNGIYVSDFNITDAYFINTTNDTSITLTASQNYLDISNVNSVRKFITGILGFVLLTAFLLMSFRLGRGR